MGLPVIIALAVVVVALAYGLGTYLRRREGLFSGPGRPSRLQRLPGPAADRETQAVVSWLLSQAFEQTGVRVAEDKIAYQRVVEAARKAVETLKTQKTVTISLPFLTADAAGPKHFEIQLTREVIQELARY